MNYFRRSYIAGNNLPLTTVATLRGNVRRHNADTTSAAPYFPGLVSGSTLDVTSHAGTAVVTLTSQAMPSVLVELNSSLSLIGVAAFDADGCIGLRTLQSTDAYVRVNGGTGAAALGFDVNAQTFMARSGEIPSSTEGRQGTWFGTKFPNDGEDLTAASFNKAIAAVAGNADVLYTEFLRQEVEIVRVSSGTVPATSTATYIDLPPSQLAFVGLVAGSTVTELSRFFYVVNGAFDSLAHCKVTAVTNTSGQSLLGTFPYPTLISSAAITAIPNSSTIQASSVDFVSAGVTTNHYAQISGATNSTTYSNNRWWAIEGVSLHHLTLRPLSRAEAELFGVTAWPVGEQPVLELSNEGSGFGTVTVSRGPWASGVRLQVSPALPHGFNYRVYAAVPSNKRTRKLTSAAESPFAASGHIVTTKKTADGILRFTPSPLTVTANTLVIPTLSVRWNGEVVELPSATLPRTAGMTNYVYLNLNNACALEVHTAMVNDSSLEPVAMIAADGTVTMTARLVGDGDREITVGLLNGSQFTSLPEAIAYVRHLYMSGRSTRCSIVITSANIALNSNIPIDFPLTIRGANQDTFIARSIGPTASFVLTPVGKLLLRDLNISPPENPIVTGDLRGVTFQNVQFGEVVQVSSGQDYSLTLTNTAGSTRAALNTSSTYELYLGTTAAAVIIGKVGGSTRVDGSFDTSTIDWSGPMTLGALRATNIVIGRTLADLSMHASAFALDASSVAMLAPVSITGNLTVTGDVSIGQSAGAGSRSHIAFSGLQTASVLGYVGAFLDVTGVDASFVLAGNKNAGSANTGPDILLMSKATRTAGHIVKVMNNSNSELLAIDYQGALRGFRTDASPLADVIVGSTNHRNAGNVFEVQNGIGLGWVLQVGYDGKVKDQNGREFNGLPTESTPYNLVGGLGTGWSDNTGSPFRCRKTLDQMVHMYGGLSNTSGAQKTNGEIATILTQWRPVRTMVFQCTVQTAGTYSSAWVSLNATTGVLALLQGTVDAGAVIELDNIVFFSSSSG